MPIFGEIQGKYTQAFVILWRDMLPGYLVSGCKAVEE